MSWSQQDLSFKKLSNKRVTTSTGKGLSEEKGASSLELYLPDIKTELIPGTGSTASGLNGVLYYYGPTASSGQTLVVDTSVPGNLTWFASSGYGNTTNANDGSEASESQRLFNWVSDKYDSFGTVSGAGYEIKLYDNSGNLITKSDASNWLFDYQTGILLFNGATLSNGNPVSTSGPYRIVGWRYVGQKGTIPAYFGGSGFTTYTKGDLLVGAGATFIKFNVGTDNYILSADSTTDTGLKWVVNSGSGSGITVLNNLTTATQFFTVGTSGSLFNISSSGSTHTFNIPIAGTGSTGLVSTIAQSFAGIKTFTNDVVVSSSTVSTSPTSGALVVTGGIGIGGSLYVASATGISGVTINNGIITGTLVGSATSAGFATTSNYSHQSGYAITSGTATTSYSAFVNVASTSSSHSLLFSPISASSSGTGLSINSTLNFNPSANILYTSGLAITASTVSSSVSTGALTVNGGVGISGRLSFNQAAFGTTGITTNPTFAMIGNTGDPIYMSVLEDNTISFEGSQGQLFSITPNLSTGYIYSVNDITGIPLLRANANGNVTANEYAGNFGIGLSNPAYKLHVIGSVGFTSVISSTSTTSGTLVVGGGVGIGGSLYVSSASNISNVILNNGNIVGNLIGTATTSTNLNVVLAGSNSNHQILFTPTSGSASGVAVSTNNTLFYNPSANILSVSGLAITAGTASTSPTTGALVVAGGVGIGGSLYVSGDFTVNGTTTTINSVTLTVDDKNIELGSVASPSDFTAEGGGITLKGSTDKSINWYTGTGWSSSESWNLSSGQTYKINNTTVLSNSSLGTGVTNSSLTALGIISTGVWAATAITTLYGGTGNLTPFTVGDLLYANTSTTWARLAASSNTGYVLTSAGTGATPVYINPTTVTVGLATTSNNINVVLAASNANHPLLFTPSTGTASGAAVSNDNTLVFNPLTETLTVSGLAVTSSLASTSTTTGALIVTGGVGIGGSLYVSSASNISNVLMNNGTVTGTLSGYATTSNNLRIASAGNSNLAHPVLFTPSSSTSGSAVSSDYTFSFNSSTEILSVSGLAVTNTTGSTSSSAGALTVAGGVGIGGTVNIQGDETVFGRLYYTQSTVGIAGTTVIPSISFIGQNNNPITLSVLSDNTLSFEGSSGQLFSINNNLSSGTIFSVNDISGIPILRANANGTLSMGEFSGNVGIGLSLPSYKLHVAGDTNLSSGYVYRINGNSVLSSATLGTGVTNSSLTSVGTITSGTWAGTLITSLYGGTGYASYTKGDLLVGSGTSLLKVGSGTSNFVLSSHSMYPAGVGWTWVTAVGVGTSPPLNYHDSDLWWNANDGTLNLNYNDGDSSQWVEIAGGSGIDLSQPVHITSTVVSTDVYTGALIVDGGVGIQGALNTSSLAISGNLSVGSSVIAGSWAGNAVTARYGGTGYTSYTKGDLLVGAGSTFIKVGIGLSHQVLGYSPTSSSGLGWTDLSLSSPVSTNYGCFFSTVTQPVYGLNTITPVTVNSTYEAANIEIYGGAGTSSRVRILNGGVYNIQFSIQMNLSAGTQPKTGDFWFRINGSDVPWSNSRQTITGKDFQHIFSMNFVSTFNSGQYFELMMSSNDSNFILEATTSLTGPTRPDIPSVIYTVTKVL
jgi:hypothetical protein